MHSRRICNPDIIARFFRGQALHFLPHEDPHPEVPRVPDSRRSAVAGLVITFLLVLVGAVLVHSLSRTAKLQDCVMSGRTNCAPIDPAPDGHTG